MSPYRKRLVESRAIVPAEAVDFGSIFGLQVLRLDDVARARAQQHIIEGDYGRELMLMPGGLGTWHEKELERREKRARSTSRKLN